MDGQVEDIFKMLIRNNNSIPGIARPLVRTNKSSYKLVLINNVVLDSVNVLVFPSLYDKAKRADIIFRGMVVNAYIPLSHFLSPTRTFIGIQP